jgi:drug/metabolite transporter (DMT)-like permease
VPSAPQALSIALLAIGPMGAAFFLWDAALKRGDPRTIGALAYLTPLGSTLCLLASGVGSPTPIIGIATLLIVGGAILGAARGVAD